MTLATLQLLALLIQDREHPVYGLELVRAMGSKSGTIYPILARLERAGWIRSVWEEVDASVAKRPRRRLYELTGFGEANARAEIERYRGSLDPQTRVVWPPSPRGLTI